MVTSKVGIIQRKCGDDCWVADMSSTSTSLNSLLLFKSKPLLLLKSILISISLHLFVPVGPPSLLLDFVIPNCQLEAALKFFKKLSRCHVIIHYSSARGTFTSNWVCIISSYLDWGDLIYCAFQKYEVEKIFGKIYIFFH